MIRLYTDCELFEESQVILTPPQHHYLVNVMRLTEGKPLTLFNGRDGLWLGTLRNKKAIVGACLQEQPVAPNPLYLFFSPIKRQNWLVEKACELGVTHFFPILCNRSCVRYFSIERHQKIAIEACEQSQRLTIPVFSPMETLPYHLDHYLSQHISHCSGFVNPLEGSTILCLDPSASLDIHQAPKSLGLCVGPEGGWSTEELLTFQNPQLIRVNLGPFILRAETAALVGISALLFK